MILFWIAVFIISLAVLVKGSDWLLESAEKIGLNLGMSPFVIGVTIVAVGTSFPELTSSIVSVFAGLDEIVVANAVGSNIANILLVVGLSSIAAKRLQVTKDLIDLELPLLAISTAIFLMVAWDGSVNFFESLFLIATFIIYTGFALIYKDDEHDKKVSIPKLHAKDFILLVAGVLGLTVGAKYLIDAVSELSSLLNIAPGLIAITAVAVGTSLPEIIVSVKAALRKQSEVALGNVLGSNIFNVLMVVGIPGLFGELSIDSQTMSIGLPVLVMTTVLFIFSGISRRIHVQEGTLFILLYIIFTAKLFGLF